jgi:hypothetical protein
VFNSRFRALAAVMAFAAAALVGCGGGSSDDDDSASVRLVNATLTHASINLLANSTTIITGTATDAVSTYAGISDGSPSLQINDANSGAVLAVTAPTVEKDQKIALIAYESGGSVRTAVISEGTTEPNSNTAIVRVFNAATDAGAIDVYFTEPSVDITTLSAPTYSFGASSTVAASNFASFGPGTYRVRVTGAGNPSDLRLDIPSVVLASQDVATVILTPTTGGTLANGSVLIEDGAYAATRNTNARVRLVAAVTPGASVSASASGVAVGSNVAPSFGTYVSVPSGSPLSITVNGAPVAAPATALAAGSDSSLMVYGNAANPTATLIADDNHLPVAINNYKLRMINGVTGAAVPLTLVVNFETLASGVQPGTASPYSVKSATLQDTQIEVTSPNSLTPIFEKNDASLPGSSVFTLFMLGDASAPIGRLSKDR